jgi:hypothetical protein
MLDKLHFTVPIKKSIQTLSQFMIKLVVISLIFLEVIYVFPVSAQDILKMEGNSTDMTPMPPSSPGISFSSDWKNGITGPGNWLALQAVASDRFQRVTGPFLHSRYAVRVEVRPGDDPIHASGERAEATVMTDVNGNRLYENESSGTQYFAFSVRLDSSWLAPQPLGHWGSIFQLHGPDSIPVSPAFAISATDKFYVYMQSGDFDASPETPTYRYFELSKSNLNLGHWVDFVIRIKFAKDCTGSFDVWRRDEGEDEFTLVLSENNVPTLLYRSSLGSVGNHYWKYGYYRPKQTTITNILWLGGLARGATFDDVVLAAFPPKQSWSVYLPQVFQ